jgi:hypothetical protein
MDTASSPQASLTGRTFGEFVVREQMSSGGFGMVFRAEQPALARLLAVQGPLSLERFVPLLGRICEVVHTAHEQGWPAPRQLNVLAPGELVRVAGGWQTCTCPTGSTYGKTSYGC